MHLPLSELDHIAEKYQTEAGFRFNWYQGSAEQQLLDSSLSLLQEQELPAELLAQKLFWINLYNALSLGVAETHFLSGDERVDHLSFRQPLVTINGVTLSLDHIEHGILRQGRRKYLGLVSQKIDLSRLKGAETIPVDGRIHAVLFTGSRSSPPLGFIDDESQLQTRFDQYLRQHVKVDVDKHRAQVPAFFRWYKEDFSDEQALDDLLFSFLRKYYNLDDDLGSSHWTISILDYQWALAASFE